MSGSLAIFIIGKIGNPVLILLFWLLCTTLFCVSSLFTVKFYAIEKAIDKILIVSFLTFIGFFCASSIGLMTILGLPVLVPFFVFIIVLLIGSRKKATQESVP